MTKDGERIMNQRWVAGVLAALMIGSTGTAAIATEARPTAAPVSVAAIAPDGISWQSVDSTCFSEIAYSEAEQTLFVRFLDSGAAYCYTGFTLTAWESFIGADSLGRWYNQ